MEVIRWVPLVVVAVVAVADVVAAVEAVGAVVVAVAIVAGAVAALQESESYVGASGPAGTARSWVVFRANRGINRSSLPTPQDGC